MKTILAIDPAKSNSVFSRLRSDSLKYPRHPLRA